MEKDKKINFEEALARLETIVRSLETASAPLDESLKLYEEGIALVKICRSELKNAEKKVKILTAKGDGSVDEEDFE